MTTEQAVVAGRETYGEPKKIAQIEFAQGRRPRARVGVTRMGFTYLSARRDDRQGARPARVHRVRLLLQGVPVVRAAARRFDCEPLLVRLEWRQKHTGVVAASTASSRSASRRSTRSPTCRCAGSRALEYEEGTTQSNGRVLRSVPGRVDAAVPAPALRRRVGRRARAVTPMQRVPGRWPW